MNIGIWGVEAYVPETILTNEDLIKSTGIDSSDEWIQSRSGIKQRHIADEDQGASDLALPAINRLLENLQLTPQDIDFIVCATSTPDYPGFPSTAALIQDKGGFGKIPAFDVSAACTGFNYALAVAQGFISTGVGKKGLVVATDCLTKLLNWQDRSTSVLFGDGAGAAVVGEVKEGYGILSTNLHADGSLGDSLKVPAGGSLVTLTPEKLENAENTIYMDGRKVFKAAIDVVEPSLIKGLTDANLEVSDIDWFIFHQANNRIIDHVCQKLTLPEAKVIKVIHQFGNTSAASIPLAMDEAIKQKKIKEGDTCALVGFGAGFTWSTIIITFGGRVNDN